MWHEVFWKILWALVGRCGCGCGAPVGVEMAGDCGTGPRGSHRAGPLQSRILWQGKEEMVGTPTPGAAWGSETTGGITQGLS